MEWLTFSGGHPAKGEIHVLLLGVGPQGIGKKIFSPVTQSLSPVTQSQGEISWGMEAEAVRLIPFVIESRIFGGGRVVGFGQPPNLC